MKLIYSGRTKEFTPDLEEKFVAKLAKLGKLIEQRGEREAHVTHRVERHLHKIEVIVNCLDHSLVGEGIDADLCCSLNQAIERLEKQIVRLRTRSRDTQRDPLGVRNGKEEWEVSSEASVNGSHVLNGNGRPGATKVSAHGTIEKPRVFRVTYAEDQKPMTLEEALLEINGSDDPYLVYRNADKDCLSVLIRRHDGNLDLVE